VAVDRLGFRLYLITDRHVLTKQRTLVEAVERALRGGVRAVQLREKDLSAAELFALAGQLRSLTRRYGTPLLINDRIDIALAVEADGVHLGAGSLPLAEARRLLGPRKLIGYSAHRVDELISASSGGADFVTFSPIYHTPSKAAWGPPQGIERLRQACRASRLPVFALGGIRKEHLPEVLAAGAHGVAVISAILAAPDPTEAAEALTGAVHSPAVLSPDAL
jgi:thiamine-phosphate pyrophosphorylase